MIEVLIIIFQLIVLICWLLLLRWYSLIGHIDTPFFALDKIPGHFQSPVIKNTLIIFVILTLIYLLNALLLRHLKNRRIKNIFILITVISVVIPIFVYPVGAVDLFNYLAQEKLFYFYHQNPYINSFTIFPNDPFWNNAAFLNQTLAYGPAWLISTFIPKIFVNFSAQNFLLIGTLAYKFFNLFLLFLIGYLVTKISKDNTQKTLSWYLLVANPFVLFEILSNGHNDILIALFLILSVYFYQKKSFLTFLFLTLASLTKIYCLVLIPFILLRTIIKKWPFKIIKKGIIVSFLVFILAYLPFVWGNNLRVFLIGLLDSQKIYTYSVLSLIRENLSSYPNQANLLNLIYVVLFLLFLIISVLITFKTIPKNISLTIFLIFNLFIALLSLSHPWYYIPSLMLLINSSIKKSNIFLISFLTLSLLVFYPISVWAWFNSGLDVFGIHLVQSAFILLPILFSVLFLLQKSPKIKLSL